MKLKKLTCLCIILLNFIFITDVAAIDYQMGFNDNLSITYEYKTINITLLDFLAEKDSFYEGLSDIEEGLLTKKEIYNIVEQVENWTIYARNYLYINNSMIYSGDLLYTCYKTPDLFSFAFFNYGDVSLEFLPIATIRYLKSFNNTIPVENNETFIDNDNRLVLDFTKKGKNETIIYSYNEVGLLDEYYILCDGDIALFKKLNNYWYEDNNLILSIVLTIVIISSLVCLFSLIIIYRKKKKKKINQKKHKVNRLLKKIR